MTRSACACARLINLRATAGYVFFGGDVLKLQSSLKHDACAVRVILFLESNLPRQIGSEAELALSLALLAL